MKGKKVKKGAEELSPEDFPAPDPRTRGEEDVELAADARASKGSEPLAHAPPVPAPYRSQRSEVSEGDKLLALAIVHDREVPTRTGQQQSVSDDSPAPSTATTQMQLTDSTSPSPGAFAIGGTTNGNITSTVEDSQTYPNHSNDEANGVNETLINAVLVDNSSFEPSGAVVEAKAVSPFHRRLFIAGFLVLVVGIVVAVVVPLTTSSSSEGAETLPPTPAPTFPNEVGNGQCDSALNIPEFLLDGGDCCEATCESNSISSFVCGRQNDGYTDVGYFFCQEELNSWRPNSVSINSSTTFARSGSSLALSNNGKVLVVGEPGVDTVRIFDKDGSQWRPRGAPLEGPVGSNFGQTVAMATLSDRHARSNPTELLQVVLAVAGPSLNENTGMVRVFDCSTQGCTPIGEDIVGEESDGEFGRSLSISSDGTVLAVARPGRIGFERGVVRIFELAEDGRWLQLRGIIEDDNAIYVSLSGDANSLAVGSLVWKRADAPTVMAYALDAQVYDWDSVTWIPRGEPFLNFGTPHLYSYPREQYPFQSVSLSSNGLIVAIATLYGIPGVEVYGWDDDAWILRDTIISSDAMNRAGWSVELSNDGSILAVGIDNVESSNATLLAFQWNGTAYQRLWNPIPGGQATSVALSSDGSVLAIGYPYLEGGSSQVYDYLEPSPCDVGSPLLLISLTTDVNADQTRWTLETRSGQSLLRNGPFANQEFVSFVDEVCLPPGECVIFTIYFEDAGSPGGINDPGGYHLFLDGEQITEDNSSLESMVLFDRISLGDCSCGNLSSFRVVLGTGCRPEETTWDVVDVKSGDIVLAGGPYDSTLEFQTVVADTCLPSDTCATFTIRDSVGDGFCTVGVSSIDLSLDDEPVEMTYFGGGFQSSVSFGNCVPSAAPSFVEIECNANETSFRFELALRNTFLSEITWKVVEESGLIILQGGPYDRNNPERFFAESGCVRAGECATFTLQAAGGGIEEYTMAINQGEQVISGPMFEDSFRFGDCAPTASPSPSTLPSSPPVENPIECGGDLSAFRFDIDLNSISEATTWDLSTESGEVLLRGGPYLTPQFGQVVFVNQTCLDLEGSCFTLRIDFCCASFDANTFGGYRILLDGSVLESSTEVRVPSTDILRFGDTCVPTTEPSAMPVAPSSAPSFQPSLGECDEGLSRFRLELLTDSMPFQTSWDLVDQSGQMLLQRGPLGETDYVRTFVDEACIDQNMCTTLTLYDTTGDGICCHFNAGNFDVFVDDVRIAHGGVFGFEKVIPIGNCWPSAAPSFVTNFTCEEGLSLLRLELTTDFIPRETTWDIVSTAGQVIQQGGPYPDAYSTYIEELCLDATVCTTFTIRDVDGFCCFAGPGEYIVYVDSTEVGRGGNFVEQEVVLVGNCPQSTTLP